MYSNKDQTPDTVILSYNYEEINLSEYSIEQLWLLHYEQEKSFADLIKKSKPFSAERGIIMKNGYETINKIMMDRKKKEGKKLDSFGAQDSYIKLVKKIVEKILKKKNKCLFFEAGVGTGKIITNIATLKNVIAVGCDVYVNKNYINSDLTVYESTIYEALLKLTDNSIDVFYWNDVLEHIPEDEIEEYLKLLYKKINNEGIIINITPNKLKGPHDITRHFEPYGTIAKGFHFHEYTFSEILKVFQKNQFYSAYGIFGDVKIGLYVLGSSNIDKIKILIEKIAKKFPLKIKKLLLRMISGDISILKKN